MVATDGRGVAGHAGIAATGRSRGRPGFSARHTARRAGSRAGPGLRGRAAAHRRRTRNRPAGPRPRCRRATTGRERPRPRWPSPWAGRGRGDGRTAAHVRARRHHHLQRAAAAGHRAPGGTARTPLPHAADGGAADRQVVAAGGTARGRCGLGAHRADPHRGGLGGRRRARRLPRCAEARPRGRRRQYLPRPGGGHWARPPALGAGAGPAGADPGRRPGAGGVPGGPPDRAVR